MAGCRASSPRACPHFNAVALLVVFDGGHAVLQALDAGAYPFGLSSLLDPVRVMAAIPGQPVDFGAVGCAAFDGGVVSMRKLP